MNQPVRCGWRGYCWQQFPCLCHSCVKAHGLLVLEDPSTLLRNNLPSVLLWNMGKLLTIYLWRVVSLKHCWTSCGVVKKLAEGIQIDIFPSLIFSVAVWTMLYSAYIVPFAFYITWWFYNVILCLLFVGISCLNMDLGLQLSSAQPVRTIP